MSEKTLHHEPDRKIQPPLQEIAEMELIHAAHHKLDNGIPCYEVHGGFEEVVKIEFLFKAGAFFQEKPLVAAATNDLIPDGTKNLSAKEISEKIEYYGVVFNSSYGKDFASLEVYTLNEHLPGILPLFREFLTNANFPEEELEHYVDKEKNKFQEDLGKVSFLARQRFTEVMFGTEHPYGSIARNPSDFDKLQREDLLKFFNDRYDLAHCDIIVSGKTSGKVYEALNQNFGHLNLKEDAVVDPDVMDPEPPDEKQHFVEKKDALQAAIRIGRPLFNKTHPDHAKMLMVSTILGGYFGSRLMSNIREDKGYTYGVGSAIISLRQGGFFFLTTEVGSDVKDQALEEIYKEICRLREELVPDEELSLVKNYLAGKFLRGADGPFAMAEMFKGIHKFGLSYEHYDHLLDTVNQITAEDIRTMARKYLQEEDLYEVVAGKSSN